MKPFGLFLSMLAGAIIAAPSYGEAPASMSVTDIMQFESAKKPVLSDSGKVLAVTVAPDRGDPRGLVRLVGSEKQFDLAQAQKPVISPMGRYVAFDRVPTLLEKETASKNDKKKLKNGLVVLDTQTGEQLQYERVKSYQFTEKDSHLVVWFEAESKEAEAKESDVKSSENLVEITSSQMKSRAKLASAEYASHRASEINSADSKKPTVDDFDKGTALSLIELATGKETAFQHVTEYALSGGNTHLAIAINDIENSRHELRLILLADASTDAMFLFRDQQFGKIALSKSGQWLAYTHGKAAEQPYGREYQLVLHDLKKDKSQYAPVDERWHYNRYSELRFSKDSQRLFFGRVPSVQQQTKLPKIEQAMDLYDLDKIAAQRNLRVWHGNDPRIKPNEIKEYEKQQKHTYLAVWHLASNALVQLADELVPDVQFNENKRLMLASSDLPYQKMITWAGFYRDYYLVDLKTGVKTQVLYQQPSRSVPQLSPQQKYLVYFQQGQVYLYDVATQDRRVLSSGAGVSFANEDHDYPSAAPGYGFGPWLAEDKGVFAYDKYDVWQFSTHANAPAQMLTSGAGRQQGIQYRVTGLIEDDSPQVFKAGEPVLLHGYNTKTKGDGFYQAKVGKSGVKPLMQGSYKLKLLARAKKSNTILYSKEAYDQYPDLYTAGVNTPQNASQQTDLDQQKDKLGWGKAELVSWTNGDGKALDGVLIKPSNYVAGQRYPVLVYFYRFMSDRLHSFPQMKVNHRPNFAWYADNGYAIFLPDIRFEVGYPGPSAVQALTSGVQHIIDMGVAKANAIGIQGHSWGGYQTAFAVTQTHMFKAAVTGAPVSNMTSAYSGIRHGTGLARQFQYETGQSRIGESLMKAPHKYIENSPVFYAERIKTPMMIMFGDRDDAVPWEQGVELYLAMRRAGKDVVFLQYEDEPHHLKKYPNKLDYTVRMQEYFGHYLKGEPAPAWLLKGEAYQELKQN
ncbi:periplasmic peptidase family S9 [Shewanella gelidii]|uniref:Periplasmic peptidase family S9 n=1 Tax=Shewanella gelidii TaxID=1642821 RepID=A0A917N783_9GAMM|nr:periplasmic peptidase family S9 [Shewanella gelidii]